MFLIIYLIAYVSAADKCTQIQNNLEDSRNEYNSLMDSSFNMYRECSIKLKNISFTSRKCEYDLYMLNIKQDECVLGINITENVNRNLLDNLNNLFNNYTILQDLYNNNTQKLEKINIEIATTKQKNILLEAELYSLNKTKSEEIEIHNTHKNELLSFINKLVQNNTIINKNYTVLQNTCISMNSIYKKQINVLNEAVFNLSKVAQNRSTLLDQALVREDSCKKRRRKITDQLATCRSKIINT